MSLPQPDTQELLRRLRARTPARVLQGRAGPAYSTRTQLALRVDHAAAVDAVQAALPHDFLLEWRPIRLESQASTLESFLLRPDLGRRLSTASLSRLADQSTKGADLIIAVGDGLSALAAVKQAPRLLPGLMERALAQGWRISPLLVIRHCRVGVLNDLGDALDPKVVILLIGERPGLATAESLSAYMAYRPRHGRTDAQRNLISNIHDDGVRPDQAIPRILALASLMRDQATSGIAIKEQPLSIGSACRAITSA